MWYVQYFDALQEHLATAPIINNSIPLNSLENSTSGMVIATNNSVVLLNFTAIWIPFFDEASTTVSMVVAALNNTSSIITDTLAWFHSFFGPQGFVTLDITLSSNQSDSNCTSGIDVPPGLADIVAWITKEVGLEINKECPTCNFGSA